MGAERDGRRPESLPRARRLTLGKEIRAVLARGKRTRTRNLDVLDSTSPVARTRVGVIVPRHGHTIVERNRLKRRLREILRREILPRLISPDPGIDVLVRARRGAYDADFAVLKAELQDWWERRWPNGSS